MNDEELERCLELAWSIENMDGHGVSGRTAEPVGTVKRKNRHYELYRDDAGEYWYKVYIETPEGLVDEETAISGKRRKKRRKGNEDHSDVPQGKEDYYSRFYSGA